MKNIQTSNKPHLWVTYLNPRNQKIRLQACSTCGVLKGPVAGDFGCANIADRVSNMMTDKGWIELQMASCQLRPAPAALA